MIGALWAGLGLWRLAVYAAVVAALVAGGYAVVDHIGDVREVEVNARWQAAVDKLKADAATELANQTGLTLKAEHQLGTLRAAVEKNDADNEKTIAALRADIRSRTRAAGGPGLRDPNAAGCGSSSGSAPSPAAADPVDRAADGAEAGGLVSEPLEQLLLEQTEVGDTINRAYIACRADALNVRSDQFIPTKGPSP